MKLPGIDGGSGLAPAMEGLLVTRRERAPRPLPRRERLSEGLIAAATIGSCIGIAALFPDSGRALVAGPTIALVIAYALATRVRFHVGAGFMSPTQVILVPMLFVVPEPWIPALVALGFLLGRLPDLVRGRVHPDRALSAVADAAYSVGPALVFAAAG